MRSIFSILLMVALAGSATAREVYVDNVVVVLDASGSMNDLMYGTGTRKISAAKSAIKEVMKHTPPTTEVGLLVFGQHRRWEYPLGPRNDEKMFAAIDRVSASGGTPLGEYMKRGTDRLLEARKEQFGYGSYRLLVVTDGEASDQNLVNSYTPDIVSRGIVVDVIGVDMRQDHTLARKVHSYRRANDPASLKKAIREVFAEVGAAADGLAGNAAFEELQGFPNEAAMTIISALATTGNEPIGAHAVAAAKPKPKPRQTNPSHASPPRKRGSRNGIFVLAVAAVIGVQMVKHFIRKG
jgi:uncharacterized protein YegL